MANFTPTKKQVSDFNNGIKYVNKVDTPSADDFNNVIESQLYSQNFAESIADTPDTSEASQVGVPSVTLINNIKNGVVYKKFKFANMKGDPGGVAPVENSQSNNTNTVPSSKLLRESSFARVYRSFADLGIPNSSTIAELHSAMIDRSRAIIPVSTFIHTAYGNTGLELPNDYFYVLEAIRSDDERLILKLVGKVSNSDVLYQYEGMYRNYGSTNKFTGWKQVINDSDAQTISGVKTFTASPIVPTTPSGPSAAVSKSYVDTAINNLLARIVALEGN